METMVSAQRGMKPVTTSITNAQKEHNQLGIKPRTPIRQVVYIID